MRENAQLLLLDKNHVESLLQPDEVLDAVREAFMLHSTAAGRVFPVVREKLAAGVFGIKAGDVETQGLLGFKAAGFWPDNRRQGGEPHQATILLFDPASGRPLCVIDGNAVTTMRTGAAGGLGLLQFARAESTDLCIFGTGVQASIQAYYALRLLPGLQTIRYLSLDGQRDAGFEAGIKAGAARDITLLPAGAADAAVAASDIVITATPGGGALFSLEAVRPGTHVNCVGADSKGKRELPAGLLARARLFVDDAGQARQLGEMQWAPETPYVELGDLYTGKAAFSRPPDAVTVFDMTGIALQDLTVARLLQQRAEASGTGTRIAWPW
jgi:ornithine cyclodeaminase